MSQEKPVNFLWFPEVPNILFRNFSSWVLGSLSSRWRMENENGGSPLEGLYGPPTEVTHTFASLLSIRTVTQPPQTAETGKCGLAPCQRKKREDYGEQSIVWYMLNPWHWNFLNTILSDGQNRRERARLCNKQVEIPKTSKTYIFAVFNY